MTYLYRKPPTVSHCNNYPLCYSKDSGDENSPRKKNRKGERYNVAEFDELRNSEQDRFLF